MDFNTTGHKQRKGGRPGRSGVAGLRGGGGLGGGGRDTWSKLQGLRQQNEWMPSPVVLSVILEASVYAREI